VPRKRLACAELGIFEAIGSGNGALIPCLRERAPAARLASIDLAHAMLWRARLQPRPMCR
jgi:trans-aconitate methyltransferase